ncbi:MAG: hypothetical protein V2I33_20245 [Kangiellaceae bacterium]|jgi:hypothetical protein|nr:hypothetical protein [Kangiellaceae bacterium]
MRERSGLTAKTKDIKDKSASPTLTFVSDPRYRSKSEMQHYKREKMLNDLSHSYNYAHVNCMERMHEREAAITDIHKATEGLTLAKLNQKRRKELFESNSRKFTVSAIGVHGVELPKFAECESKEYWKAGTGYNENPKFASAQLFNQSR